ncbi:MAG: hypothetical protein QOG76_5911, partial [Pseudonocardiales bacterium]|nr:hypothetical protein [Pseudonocardiales bacterium]
MAAEAAGRPGSSEALEGDGAAPAFVLPRRSS